MFRRSRPFAAVAAAISFSIPALATSGNADNTFNPAFSLILSGTYGTLQRDPAIPATGFAMNPNPGHEQGFNLGES